jgi:putative endonuclease
MTTIPSATTPGPAGNARRDLGRRGEEAAARWYTDAGYTVVARNWRCPDGEIDLVATDRTGLTVVVCEVKTRSSTAFGSPEEAVTASKQRRLRRLAARWLSDQHSSGSPPRSVRFDVVAVLDKGSGGLVVDVVVDAF